MQRCLEVAHTENSIRVAPPVPAREPPHSHIQHDRPFIDGNIGHGPLAPPMDMGVSTAHAGQGTGTFRLRARTRINSRSSVTSSMTRPDRPENTTPTSLPPLITSQRDGLTPSATTETATEAKPAGHFPEWPRSSRPAGSLAGLRRFSAPGDGGVVSAYDPFLASVRRA